jgi:uracil phosphoribosyltransferase
MFNLGHGKSSTAGPGHVTVLDHPLLAAKLTVLRSKWTAVDEFRHNLQEISAILLIEASRRWERSAIETETPLRSCPGNILARQVVLVPILRAGLGMAEGMQRVVPEAVVGHIGIYRNESTLLPVSYYTRLPSDLENSEVVLLDPMLATGNSASAATGQLKAHGARNIQLISVVGCARGVEQMQRDHPDVEIFVGAIDPELNEKGYIVPGLGDAGDRYFGTV